MSVYTSINQQQLEQFLQQFDLGDLLQFSGIQAGIENTNYRLTTTQGDFILTLFEGLGATEIGDYLSLMESLQKSSYPAPKPFYDRKGQIIHTIAAKPAVIFSCLPGRSVKQTSLSDCQQLGHYLAELHLITGKSGFNKQNTKDLQGCRQIYTQIATDLDADDKALLAAELEFQQQNASLSLPRGIIHADLFRDNVLFDQHKLSGVLDFYNACEDFYLYDIAVSCNDWCVDNARLDRQKLQAVLDGYQQSRGLVEEEKKYFQHFLRLAAMRFWLSRLLHQLQSRSANLTLVKDPLDFKRLLQYYRVEEVAL